MFVSKNLAFSRHTSPRRTVGAVTCGDRKTERKAAAPAAAPLSAVFVP